MTDGLPEDLAAIRRGLEASDREARALLADLDEERFNWRPDERSWSVAQCFDHLNVADRVYLASMRPAVEDARRREVLRQGPPSIPPCWSAGSSAPWSPRRNSGCQRR